jgi:hypothetical protein
MYEMEGPRSVRGPACRLPGWPVTRLLSAADRHRDQTPMLNSGFPALRTFWSCPQAARGFPRIGLASEVVSAFLLPGEGPAQGLAGANLKILWPSTGHPPLSPA